MHQASLLGQGIKVTSTVIFPVVACACLTSRMLNITDGAVPTSLPTLGEHKQFVMLCLKTLCPTGKTLSLL